ncbi:MAG: thioredoxin family protein [Kiritimatiellae bacterium]|nr:thioredoxin family protein [Kiritimatiellia bacterium]
MKKIVFAVGAFALSAFCHASVVSVTFNGYIAAKAEESTFIFAHKTIAELSECEFSGLMGGAWINSGRGLDAKGYNKEYKPGESLRVQFQCVDKSDGKEYVKCVRVVFRDEPGGVSGVCDYSGYVTRGYNKNDLGYDFRDDANWKAVDSADGAGYALASVTAKFPVKPWTDEGKIDRKLPDGFSNDYHVSRSKAVAGKKDLLLFFTGSDWCVWCKRLEKEVLSKPVFLDYATNEFECVMLDFPKDEKLVTARERKINSEVQKKFEVEVRGYPSILVVSAFDEKVKFSAGYAAGGARKWVRDFKKNLRQQPLKEKYFKAVYEESDALQKRHLSAIGKLGKPTDTASARAVLEEIAAWAADMRRVKERLETLELPVELDEERDEIVGWLKKRIAELDEFGGMDAEELIEMAGNDTEAKTLDGGGLAELQLPIAGSRSALDETENIHLPFGEKNYIQPELAMLGDTAQGLDVAGAIREWLLNNAPADVNWGSTTTEYGMAATKAWEAGARTPFVAMIHLSSGREKMAHGANMSARRAVWEKWKDDGRWPLASKICYISTWMGRDIAASNELDRILIDLKKDFVQSNDWRRDELGVAWFVLTHHRGNNKRVFDELKVSGKSYDPWLEAMALARWHIDAAWEARGDGYASTVSEQGWKLYNEHREAALEHAERAYELRPDLTASCIVGLTANYGDKPEALKWYRRAASVFKDDKSSARKFAWGLKPRWCGSVGELMAFYERFFADGFADTVMPIWALDQICWDVFKDEGGTRTERTFDEWAEKNAATIGRLGEMYLTNGVLEKATISLGTRNRAAAVFRSAAWSCGNLELYGKWSKGVEAKYGGMKYADAVANSDLFWNAGVASLADWAAKQQWADDAELARALRDAFGTWSPWRKSEQEDAESLKYFEGFEKLVMPRMASGEITERTAGDLAWGYLKMLAGKCAGLKVRQPEGCELSRILPKSIWVELKTVPAVMEVEFDLSIEGPETKGEAMLHFDFGHKSAKGFNQRFSVLTVANKTDEKDNRFAILPWPKGETKKSIRLVFRGRDVEVYDNGVLAYTRQLGEGVLSVKNLSFTRSGHTTVKVDRFFVKTSAE